MDNFDFSTVHNYCHWRPLLLLVPAVKGPNYATVNSPSCNSVSIAIDTILDTSEQLHFAKDQPVATPHSSTVTTFPLL